MIRKVISNPGAHVRTGFTTIKELLFHPDRFYENRIGTRGFTYEMVVIGLVGLVGTFGLVYAVETLTEPFAVGAGMAGGFQDDLGPSLDRTANRLLWGNAVQPLLEAFILWFVYTTAFYVLSWLYTEQGEYTDLLKSTAWGFLPFGFYNAIYSVSIVIAFYTIDVETDLPTGRPQEVANYLLDQGLTEPIAAVAGLLGVVFLVWSGYIWTYAVKEVRELPTSTARIVVAIPVGLHVLYLVWTYGRRLL